MAEVLYRKYRPGSFSQLVGQNHIRKILQESIRQNNISHAYLFSGPRGTGKTTTARIMSKALNCLKFEENLDVCNECENCKIINSGNAIDIIEMDAASNRGIEEIRVLKESINFVPTFLKRKVYIIDEVHMLTKEAFNALLKTLEEPPSHVVFLLATTEPHKLPITILSRVQRFDFGLGDEEQIITKLKRILDNDEYNYDDRILKVIYRFSGGSFRDAESLLSKLVNNASEKNLNFEEAKEALGLINEEYLENLTINILENNLEKSFETLDKVEEHSSDLAFFIVQYISFLKDKILEDIKKSNAMNVAKFANIIEELIKAKSNFRSFDDKKVLIQISLIKLINKNNIKTSSTENIISKQESVKSLKEIQKEIPHGSTKSTKDENIIQKINASDEISERLKSILSLSSIIKKDKEIIITTEYSFNVKLLEKKENIKILTNWFAKVYNEDVKIEIKKGNIPESGQDYSKSSSSGIPNEVVEKKEEFDNSDIVESIL